MKSEQFMRNMKMIFTRDEMERIVITADEQGTTNVDLDLHGLDCKQAQRLVKNVINVNRGEFILDVIHGYHNGTALKSLLLNTDWGVRVRFKNCSDVNPGRTYLAIAA